MAALPKSRSIALSARIYRLLLFVYPAEFRRAFACEMSQTFRELCRETLFNTGSLGLLRLWGRTLPDLLTTAVKEQIKILSLHLKRLSGKKSALLSTPGLEPMLLANVVQLHVAQHTDVGRRRALNEDNLISVLPEDPRIMHNKGALFVVADGMGGHTHGERASELAVNTVREMYYQSAEVDSKNALRTAIQQANTAIYAENVAQQLLSADQHGMGTTCIAAVLQEKNLIVANVGDSRAYIVHEGQIRQVSRDHSLVADMVHAGLITAEQASRHEKRNVIYRSLGTQSEVEIDFFEEAVEEGDALILCTDGLSGLVGEAEMLRIVESYEPVESVRQLIASANAAGGPDNITAIVVLVSPQT